jgi:branched-chain amino acid transport system substrate-binding protein
MWRTRRTYKTLAAGAAIVLIAAGCSSSGNGGGGTTSAPPETSAPGTSSGGPATQTRGVTDTSIKVGGVTTINGQGFTYVDWCNGAGIVFKKVNAAGGIAGRMIDNVGCKDDAATPDKNVAATRQLIEDDGVFAIVPGSELMTGVDLAVKANVPFFSWGISPYYCNNDQGFGYNGCTGPTNPDYDFRNWAGILKKIKPDIKTVGIISLDIPPGKVNRAATNRGNKAEGLDVVYDNGSLPLTGTNDFTPYVQQIMAANPDALECQMAYCIPLYAGLKAAGYKGILLDAVSYNPALLQADATKGPLQGVYVLVGQEPWESTNNPAIAAAIADVKKYGKPGQVLTGELAQGYTSASMFVAILEKVGKDLTYDNFYKAANGDDFCFDGGGLEGTTCFPKGHTDSNGCLAVVQAVGDKSETKYPATTCFPAPGQDASSNG